jgi:hypothetical protein
VEKFKYHMVKWEKVCLSKDFGGLGIINTRRLNEALLLKWISKQNTSGEQVSVIVTGGMVPNFEKGCTK